MLSLRPRCSPRRDEATLSPAPCHGGGLSPLPPPPPPHPGPPRGCPVAAMRSAGASPAAAAEAVPPPPPHLPSKIPPPQREGTWGHRWPRRGWAVGEEGGGVSWLRGKRVTGGVRRITARLSDPPLRATHPLPPGSATPPRQKHFRKGVRCPPPHHPVGTHSLCRGRGVGGRGV